MTTNTDLATPSTTRKMPHTTPPAEAALLRERSSAPADSLALVQVMLGIVKPPVPLADGESRLQRVVRVE